MLTVESIQVRLNAYKNKLQDKYGVRSFAVFGSVSRGESTEDIDIDMLVEFSRPIGIRFIDLAIELESILNHRVDLVSRNAIKSKYFDEIKKDLRYV